MREKLNIANPVGTVQPLRARFPELPARLAKIDPAFRDYHDAQVRIFTQVKAALDDFNDAVAFPVAELTKQVAAGGGTALVNLSARLDGLESSVSVIANAYVTDAEVGAEISTALAAAAAYTDGSVSSLSANITTNYATKVYADGTAEARKSEAIAAAATFTTGQISSVNANITTNYYTRTQTDSAIATASSTVQASAVATANAYTDAQVQAMTGGVTVYRQPTAPASPALGDIWIDSDDNNALYWWSGSAWILSTDSRITVLDARVTTVETSKVNTTDFTALSSRVDTVEASVYTPTTGILARTSTIETTFATKTFAEAKRDEAISAAQTFTTGQIAAVNADITTNYATKTYADGTAEARKTEAISAAATYTNTGLAGKVKTFRQASTPTATAVGDIWYKTDDSNRPRVWDGSAWVLVDDTRIATLDGSVSALSADITANYASKVFANTAATNAANAAQSAAITTANGYTDGRILTRSKTFRQSTTPTATATGDLWVHTGEGNRIYIWDGSSWVDTRDSLLTSVKASVDSFSSTYVNNATFTATANKTDSVYAEVFTPTTGIAARVSTVETSKVDASGAYAQALSAISAQSTGSGTIKVLVDAETSARTSAINSLHARWGVAIDVNGRVVGSIKLDGTGQTSKFSVRADQFEVVSGASTATPFTITSGVPTLNGFVATGSGESAVAVDSTQLKYGRFTTTVVGGTSTRSRWDATSGGLGGAIDVFAYWTTGVPVSITGTTDGTTKFSISSNGSSSFQSLKLPNGSSGDPSLYFDNVNNGFGEHYGPYVKCQGSTWPFRIRGGALVLGWTGHGNNYTPGRIYDENGNQILRERYTGGGMSTLADVIACLTYHGLA